MSTRVSKLSGLSWSWCQVHGAEHNATVSAERVIKEITTHVIVVYPFMQQFEALLYKNDGEICVVAGPIAKPRHVDDKMLFHAESRLVMSVKGCLWLGERFTLKW